MSKAWIIIMLYMAVGSFLTGRYGRRKVRYMPSWFEFRRAVARTCTTPFQKKRWLGFGYGLLYLQLLAFSLVIWPFIYWKRK